MKAKKKFVEAVIVCVLLSLVTPLNAAPPWLHVEGNKIKDPNDDTVVLRGISLIDLGVLEDDRGGAELMVEAGAMEGVEAVFGLHVSSSTPVGSVEVSPGPVMATANQFKGAILGKSSHGAVPEEGIDAIHLAAQVITAANAIVSRRISPETSAVISLGTISGGTEFNVIADRVELSGTIRYMQPEVREQIHDEIESAFEIARTLGGDYVLQFEHGGGPMINDAGVTALIREVGAELLGDDHVLPHRMEMISRRG